MVLEVCTNSYESAINAESAGAQRIELCSELAVGGITPSYGLISAVIKTLTIPVFVLIRPRSGNFTYCNNEFEIMKRDIALCKDLGCAGIVSGILNDNGTIDANRTQELVEFSRPLTFTFHRAFDWVPNPFDAIRQLTEMGVDRVLTSGQQPTAEKGIGLLSQLKDEVRGAIKILPGGGINPNNAVLFKRAGFAEIHVSATTIEVVNSLPKVPLNSAKFFDETIRTYSNKDTIEAILKSIR